MENVLSVIKSSIKPAIFQLEIASEKVKENPLAKTAVDSAVSLISQIEHLAAEQHNKDVDEFNILCDEAERLQRELDKSNLALFSLREQINDITNQALQKEAEAEGLKSDFALTRAALKDKNELLKRYKQMQPDKLKASNVDLKKRLDDARKIKDSYKIQIDRLKKELFVTDKRLQTQLTVNVGIATENNDLKKRMMFHDGHVEPKEFRSEGKEAGCYIYTFEHGLTFKTDDKSINFINDLGWHKEIKTGLGIHIHVSVSDWLMPIYPAVKEIAGYIPDEINDELHRQIIERVELTHPHLVDRMNWAKDTYLDSIPEIDEKIIEILSIAEITTVFGVVNLPKTLFLNHLKKHSEIGASDISDKDVDKLYSILNKASDEFMKQRNIDIDE